VSTPNKFATLDSDVLLALEAGDEDCQETIDGLSKLGFYFIVTETVLQEIADITHKGEDSEVCAHAKNVLVQMTNWGFLAPPLDRIQMGVAERVAQDLVAKVIPDGHLDDGLVLAESAYHSCKLLITKRAAILKSNRDAIRMSLIGSDLAGVLIASPNEMVAILKEIEKAHP
jgi:hypothetical protein